MKCFSVLLLTVALGMAAIAQPLDTLWTRTYGGEGHDNGAAVCATFDGRYVIAGQTEPAGSQNTDAWLFKTDSAGSVEWSHTYGGPNYDWFNACTQTTDSGLILVGECNDVGHFGTGWVVKTNRFGDTLWTRTITLDTMVELKAVSLTADGGYIIAGHSGHNHSGPCDAVLVRMNSEGDTLWTHTYGDQMLDQHFNAVRQTSDGGFIAAGWWWGQGVSTWIVRLNATGDTLWTRIVDNGWVYAVTVTPEGNFIFGGTGTSRGHFYRGMHLQEMSDHGDSLWAFTYGSATSEWQAFDMLQTNDGGFLLAGLEFTASPSAIRLLQTNADADSVWSMTVSNTLGQANAIARTSTGAYVVAGTVYSADQLHSYVWLAKLGYAQPSRATPLGMGVPSTFRVSASPNPFNPSTQIAFSLPETGHVNLEVFDLVGRELATLHDGMLSAGEHTINFDGSRLSTGIYFARLLSPHRQVTLKLMLIK